MGTPSSRRWALERPEREELSNVSHRRPHRLRTTITAHRLVSVAAAGAAGLISWVGIHVVGGIDLVVGHGQDAQTIAGRVVASAMAAALCGWAVLALIERRIGPGQRALRLWGCISLGTVAVSLVGPLTADAPTSTRWWLVALHTSVAAVFISLMSGRAAPAGRRRRGDR
ncbi:MAG: hypothetical protein GEV08_18910 [Acidimicrobiia bacterium]|nr:hypothetical protein [Acidimicrobiia bacterium]